MTIYICKCGRRVSKSTNADNTGNRDTENCKGCPYLLPWGPMEWTGKSFEQNVQGHECRMSPEISYATDYSGNADDKCALKIHSLDLDFLEEVQAWIDEYADGQLSGRFSRDTIRGTDYCNKGRYSWSISCAQNKKGMAAKAALIERFFGPDGHRLDKTPKEEKAIVLAAIEAGKAQAQKKEDKTLMYKDPVTGWLYRVSPNPINDKGLYELEYLDQQNSTIWKPDVYWNTNAVYRDQEHLQEALDDRARRDGWELVEDVPAENPTDAAEDVQQGGEDDLPEVCRGCQCVTCGNEDCASPCWLDPKEVNDCKIVGPAGGDCKDYQPKEDAQCQKENAPSADAAATSDGSAARMCEGPDEETRTTPAAASGAALESLHAQSVLPQNAPAQDIAADAPSAQGFDFSALGDMAEQATEADAQFDLHYGLAQEEYVVSCIYLARIHALTAKAGRYGGGTWTAWYQSKGISDGTKNRMLEIGYGFKSATVADLKNLPELTKKELNLIARNGVANQVVEAAGEGDSDRIQDILNQLKAVQTERDEARKAKEKAEQERDAARDAQANLSAMANKFSKQRDAAEQRVEDAERRAEEAHKAANTYHCQYEEANAQKNALLDKQGAYIYQVAAAEQRAEEAERRARAAEEDAAGWKQAGLEMQELVDQRDERIRELESGITVEAAAVDQEEIERRANELSEPLVKIINQQNEEIQQLAAGNTVSAQASVLEHYLKTMEASLLSNAQRAELASYDIGALDSLARALREFADSIDGIFEDRSEDND